MVLSGVNFWLAVACGIEDYLHIFSILYYSDTFKFIQLLFTSLQFQARCDFEMVLLPISDSNQIYGDINRDNWWWNTQVWHPVDIMMVQGISLSDNIHLIDISHNRYSSPQNLTVGIVYIEMCYSPNKCTSILLGTVHVSEREPQILITHSIA